MKYGVLNQDVLWQELIVTKEDRKKLKGHNPAVIWLTGFSGAGKTTLSKEIERRMYEMGIHTYLLDGDNVRRGLNSDLGFSKPERKENIRRISEVANLFVDAGIVVICAFISPYEEDRSYLKSLLNEDELYTVYVKCPIDVCMERDPKGLYRKALKGEIKGFTGIDAPYEEPESPDIVVETHKYGIEECADLVIDYLKKNGLFNSTPVN